MSQKIKRVKLKRNRIWVTILLFLLTEIVIVLFALMMVGYSAVMMIKPLIYNEVEEAVKISDDLSQGADISSYGRDHIVTDPAGEYISISGEDTRMTDINLVYDSDYGFFSADKEGAPSAPVYTIYPDREADIFAEVGDSVNGSNFETVIISDIVAVYNRTTLANLINGGKRTMYLPFWTAVPMDDGNTLYVKSGIDIDLSSVAELMVLMRIALIIFGVIFVFMLINVINSIVTYNRLTRLFFTDPVTGGRNWNWFLLKGEPLVRRHRGKTYAIFSIGLEKYLNYCLINCNAKGEKVLCEIDMAVRQQIRRQDICVHCNTSDFAVLVKVRDGADARTRSQSLLSTVENVIAGTGMITHIGEYTVDVLCTERGRVLPRNNFDIEAAYNNARTARASIPAGTARAALFDEEMVEQRRWENTVLEHLSSAIDNSEFIVYYQPKYDPKTDTLMGAEALIRWQSPEFGFLSPYKFIPILEENNRITEIDHYMLSHVAADQRRWLDMGLKCVPVSVNISRIHFAEPDLPEQIRDIVDACGTPHELIEIELTESAFFDDKQAMLNAISRLKGYGFMVSMDDFGSGYSSLNSLKEMPLDVLKLDAGFFRGDTSDERGKIVVEEAIKLAKSLNMRTVAEGIEEKGQVEFLAAADCDMIQGYFYAKPMPGSEYEKKMNNAE